jgi:hypothetical protein
VSALDAGPLANQIAVAQHLVESGHLPAFYYGIAGPRADAFVALDAAGFTDADLDGPHLVYRLNDAGHAWLASQGG